MSHHWNGRLARLEEQRIEAHVARLAAEFGLTPEEILDEAERCIAFYDLHRRYPDDIEWALAFIDEHGRMPAVAEWPDVVD